MKTVIAGAAFALALAGVAAAQDQPQGERHHEGEARPAGQARPQGPSAQGQARPQGAAQGQPGSYQGRGGPGGGFQRPQAAPVQAAPAQSAPTPTVQAGRTGGPTFPGGQGGYRSGAQGGRPSYGIQGAPVPGGQGGAQGQFGQRDDRGQGSGGQRFNGYRPGAPAQGYGGRYGGGGFSYRGRTYERFHAAPFRFPRGYGYRAYRLHERLPLLFLSSSFFLNDYGAYDLAPPPSPEFRWVRYGPDALLVDVYSGEVVDAVYSVFDDGSGYYGDEGYQRYTQPNPAYSY